MHDVYINGFGAFFPGPPVGNDAMETYLGRIGGKPSRYRPVVLRNNGITTRHYALDENGVARHSNASMAAAAIRAAADSSELLLGDLSYLATATTLGDVLLPGLASQVHAELGIGPIAIASLHRVCAGSLMALKAASAQTLWKLAISIGPIPSSACTWDARPGNSTSPKVVAVAR